mmetsp:Transcript_19191/g.76911  ORF Transcript_19191/g.76911 Transcript_19191/m.76911 type:complete len:418 (-) Transcript_19191:1196-2449(-)|eukprot:CAMPEP_0113970954 /NCGR_PEP_ID=MMETSP0011_2-20120614/11755_1 /TAXON_ID=101924 /ORGANISM="Rhodosorus marinus" /LENGTH=417 /DNA_ID=CAMNT_0000985971 /DNA_START=132 /DNA_END=1385 /DNA_ORIENTATION=- /assembly_acc=CAM_ASM_000156
MLIVLGIVVLSIVVLCVFVRYIGLRTRNGRLRATVVVLGDVERSPRIRRQAVELVDDDWEVTLVGYIEPGSKLKDGESIDGFTLRNAPYGFVVRARGIMYFALAGLAAIYRAFALLVLVLKLPVQDIFLIQNPPCIPTFLVVIIAMAIRHPRASLVIDWHNLAYTIMSSNPRVPAAAVRLAKVYEQVFSHFADAHFSVTNALASFLHRNFGIANVAVLPDRPSPMFRPGLALPESLRSSLGSDIIDGRGALAISSTSWTPDENFSVLLDALPLIDRQLCAPAGKRQMPSSLTILITGRGPLRSQFEEKLSKLSLRKVTMKALDMLGCGLPVLSPSYPSVSELIEDGRNGLLFNTPVQLAHHITVLLCDWPEGEVLNSLKKTAVGWFAEPQDKWRPTWLATARPVLRGLVEEKTLKGS